MISFVEDKNANFDLIASNLSLSKLQNQWSNFGPVSLSLEKKIKDIVGTNHSVVVTCNGTIAIHALVELQSYIHQRKLNWVVSSFGFPCTTMGPLKESQIIDCDANGMLNLSNLPDQFDGIVLTNPFGTFNNINEYINYCSSNNKILIVDCASSLIQSHIPNTMISFHHTKPWGFGEGGCVIVEKKYERIFRSILNFGLLDGAFTGNYSTNGKMSDVSAAFILDRLQNLNEFKNKYIEQYLRIVNIAQSFGFFIFGKNRSILTGSIPLIYDFPIIRIENPFVQIKKYYKPLLDTPCASNIYSRILNFPCHSDMGNLSDSELINCFQFIIKNNI